MSPYLRSRRRLASKIIPGFLLLLMSLFISACGGSQGISAAIPAPTSAPTPTPTTDPTAFRAVFYEQDAPAACPAGKQSSAFYCLTFQGNGQAVGYGTINMTRIAIVTTVADSNDCHTVTSTGSLETSRQDRITFTAPGTYCAASGTWSYTYKITGGTGKYRGARGSGTIMVNRTNLHQGNIEHRSEIWSGTLKYPR